MVATGHKSLTVAYHVLNQASPTDHDLGERLYYRGDTENTERDRRRLVRQFELLGHNVTLEPSPRPPDPQRLFRFSSLQLQESESSFNLAQTGP